MSSSPCWEVITISPIMAESLSLSIFVQGVEILSEKTKMKLLLVFNSFRDRNSQGQKLKLSEKYQMEMKDETRTL